VHALEDTPDSGEDAPPGRPPPEGPPTRGTPLAISPAFRPAASAG